MSGRLLRVLDPRELPGELLRATTHLDPATIEAAGRIVVDVRLRGEEALREHAERLGDLAPGAPLVRDRAELEAALGALPSGQRELLARTSQRIRRFADAQRGALAEVEVSVPGGRAGHALAPVAAAGCYAPGGRHPLPSSVLMTAVTARAAGVPTVWVASPRPTEVTLAAAALAGADGLLAAGGAQAIAALAFGAGAVPRCDVVVGPGNRYVTAAKKLVAGEVAIDMLAGPSELLILADAGASARLVAADLLAQAEHDPDARAMLLATDVDLIARVQRELVLQLADLPTAEAARAALSRNGFAVLCRDLAEACAQADLIAPEHLELLVEDPAALVPRLAHWGALFLGPRSAEVFGDYGAGPNHVLPTAGGARHAGGLSVLTFLRVRTWLALDGDPGSEGSGGSGDSGGTAALVRDAAALARLEGLEAHARAAEARAAPPA